MSPSLQAQLHWSTVMIYPQMQTTGHYRDLIRLLCDRWMSCIFEQNTPDNLTTVTFPRSLTGFLWGSGEGALNRPAVGVVSSTDAAFVLNLGGANLSITANFLKTTTHNRGRVVFDVAARCFGNPSIVFLILVRPWRLQCVLTTHSPRTQML